ncbi:MAG: thioredoxin family protein [Candidatus Riflebacteria bacterium]|nr:thioredoxin family protein [Candidatus Riflebacteria bacterium]
MKTRILLFSILISILCFQHCSAAVDEVWFDKLEDGINAATKEQKIVLVGFTTEWCKWCLKMKREILEADQFLIFAKDNFVKVMLDAEKNEKISAQFKIENYPTFVILDSQKNELGRIEGFKEMKDFIEILKRFVNRKDTKKK